MLRSHPLWSLFFASIVLAPLIPGHCRAQESPLELDPREAALLAPAEPGAQRHQTRRPVLELESSLRAEPSERFRVIRRSTAAEPRLGETELRMRALEGFLDFDDEEQVLYNPGRTQIIYGRYFLEADKVILDNRLQEVQAEGNVIFKVLDEDAEAGDRNEIRASSLRYNFGEGEGVGFDVQGEYTPIYFKTEASEETIAMGIAPFQQVSQLESLFQNTTVSTCNFKIPHYRIRSREVILFMDDRIFFRGATVYVGKMPIFYLPFYTRSLSGGSPWAIQVGSGSRTGTRLRIGYQYEHQTKEPSLEDENIYETRSFGQARTYVDFMSKRGIGAGFEYKYQFDFERHRGRLRTYGINDADRQVGSATSVGRRGPVLPDDEYLENTDEDPNTKDEANRWVVEWKHRSELLPGLTAIANVDMFSDPEVFYDILDQFVDGDFQRERQPQRRARGALTYTREAWVARLLVEVKDRISIDRYQDFSNPADNDFDLDYDPGAKLKDEDSNSIANSRWGRVSKRLPEFTWATRHLPIRDLPLYMLSEVRAYNNLDKGINFVDVDDDAMVRGIDIYNAVMWQWRMSERYNLLAKLGVGGGVANRSDHDLGVGLSDIRYKTLAGQQLKDGSLRDPTGSGLRLIDDDGTFMVGDEEYNLDDIQDFYAYIDASLRLNARFSDALRGYLEWRFRETTDDFVGDFYARIGDRTSRQDLFDYRLREHWLSGSLFYFLLYPRVTMYANAGINLISAGERYPNEELGYWNLGAQYQNQRQTLTLTSQVGQSRIEVGAPGSSSSGEQQFTSYRAEAEYSPIHGRWFTKLRYSHRVNSGESFESSSSDDFTFFSDEDTRSRVTWITGAEISPKWDAQVELEWDDRVDGLREIAWIIERDMHDAIATMRIRSKQSTRNRDSRNDSSRELDVSFGLTFKLPDQDISFGKGEITTLRRANRQPVVAY